MPRATPHGDHESRWLLLQRWVQPRLPDLPLFWGAVAMLFSIGILPWLVYALLIGKPTNPGSFALSIIVPSIVILVIDACQWTRRAFLIYASLIIVILVLLTAGLGQYAIHVQKLHDAQTTEQLLDAELAQSEGVVASMEIQALASSTDGSPRLAGKALSGEHTLSKELAAVSNHGLASFKLLNEIIRAEGRLKEDLLSFNGNHHPGVSSAIESAHSIAWSTYYLNAAKALRVLCVMVGPPPNVRASAALCIRGPSLRRELENSPAAFQRVILRATEEVGLALNRATPTMDKGVNVAAENEALRLAYATAAGLRLTNLTGDLSAGAGAVVTFMLPSQGSWTGAPLDTQGWVIIAILLLIGMRILLLINNRNGWGPIEIVSDGQAKPKQVDRDRIAKIRTYIIENVPEPASAPGSSVVKQVTTLATSINLGAPKWLRALANLIEWALFPPSGYRVAVDFRDTSDLTKGNEKATTKFSDISSVVIRISTRGRSRLLEVHTLYPMGRGEIELLKPSERGVRDGSPQDGIGILPLSKQSDDVLRAAGYWAAGWILSHSKLIPPWATWPPTAGRRLGDYIQHKGESDAKERDRSSGWSERYKANLESIDFLEHARASGPTSGLILTRLAEEYEFKSDFLSALEINLQVAQLYPRYYVARYRSAIGISLLVSDGIDRWNRAVADPDGRALRILKLIGQVSNLGLAGEEALSALRSDAINRISGRETIEQISLLAALELQNSIKLSKFFAMAVMSLRKEERRFWLARMRRPTLAYRNLASTMPSIGIVAGYRWPSGPPLAYVPAPPFRKPSIETVERWTKSRTTSAQVLYCLACFYALSGDGGRAVELLEEMQCHGDVDQIKASWVRRDPDLKSLHSDSTEKSIALRFWRVVNLMWGGEEARIARRQGL